MPLSFVLVKSEPIPVNTALVTPPGRCSWIPNPWHSGTLYPKFSEHLLAFKSQSENTDEHG